MAGHKSGKIDSAEDCSLVTKSRLLLIANVLTYNLSGGVRSQGLPVAGVRVVVYSVSQSVPALTPDNKICEQTTGPRGEFTIPVQPGKYRLEVHPDSTTRFLRASVSELEVFANISHNINLTTGAIISGIVRTADGARIYDGEIVASGIEPTSYSETAALDRQGRYSITLARGRYHLAFRAEQHAEAVSVAVGDSAAFEKSSVNDARTSVDQSPSFLVKSITVLDVVGDEKIDLVLPELVTFTGDVIDILDRPVSSAHVILSPSDAEDDPVLFELGLSASAVADAAGRFTMKLQPGIFDISVRPGADELLTVLEDRRVPIQKDTHYSFKLVEGFRLRGQVRYGTQPLAQCLVRINGVEKEASLFAKTDAQGQFSIGLPGGIYKLIISAHPKDAPTVTIDGAEYAGLAPWHKIVRVGGDTHVAANIEQGTAVHGCIKDDAGLPRPGVSISVFPDVGDVDDTAKPNRALCNAMSDGDGRYCFFLSPGRYNVVVHTDSKNAKPVEVKKEPIELDINWHGWCQVKFEVLGEDGKAIPRCRVGYAPYGADFSSLPTETNLPHGYLLTSEDGTCNATLLAGIYTLHFTPPLEGSYESKTVRQISLSHDVTKSVRLGLKSKVRTS